MMTISGRILVVEDDIDIAELLRIYFTGHGFLVDTVSRGDAALAACRANLPDLVILDILLPDMDGYAICRELRTNIRTSNIPIIFLTRKDERSDKIAGLELGADDYVTKPFDIEELRWRAANAIRSHQRMNLTDPTTGLPSGQLIEEQLRTLTRTENWWLILVGIDHFAPFTDYYSFVAGAEVLRFTASIVKQALAANGTAADFVGHANNETFIVITYIQDYTPLVRQLHALFQDGIKAHYKFIHSEQGGIDLEDGSRAPLMKLSLGIVSDRFRDFSDLREITEAAAESRRTTPA